MSFTPEQFAAANKASIDALLSLANTALANAERLTALNLNAARTLLEDGRSATQAVLGARDPRQAMMVATAQLRPTVEQLLSYGRSLCETSAQSKEDFGRQVEKQFNDFQAQVSSLMEQTVRHAPPGSEVAMAALHSALEAARSGFEYMKTTLRHAAELDEANIAKAGNATVDALRSAQSHGPAG